MNILTVQSAGNVPRGTNVWLTGQQAAARLHLLTPDKPEDIEAAQADLDRAKFAFKKATDRGDQTAIDKAEKARDKARDKFNERRLYTTNAQTGFKAGEEIAIEGDLDRGLQQMLGVDMQAARVEPVAVTETTGTATGA
jgi:hypothetical protein